MAQFEDFVVEEIIREFQQQQPQAAAQPQQYGTLEEAIAAGDQPAQARMSSFLAEAQRAGATRQRGGLPEGAVADPRSPQGFTIADPRLLEQHAADEAKLAGARSGGMMMDRARRELDSNRMKIMQNIRGLDPQVQAGILRQIGIDAPAVKPQLEQQKELATHRAALAQPQQEMQNAIRMLLATQAGQQNLAQSEFRERQLQSQTAGREQGQNIQLMRVLAAMMQSDPRLAQTIGPVLMQLLGASGINLAPPAAPGASAGGRAGVRITREK
jgi:hypothetical protein